MADDLSRLPGKIDAILMGDIEHFFCKNEFCSELFRGVFESYFSGQDEVKSRLSFMIDVRNKLYHGSHVSESERERVICYAHDFIECYQLYYRNVGKEKEYNVPLADASISQMDIFQIYLLDEKFLN